MAKEKWRPLNTKTIIDNLPENTIAYAVDTETSGLDATCDTIIEIGIIKVIYKNSKFEILEKKDFFIRPEIPISRRIIEITGITNEMLQNNPDENTIFPEIRNFLGDNPIFIAYNSPFDVAMVKSMYARQNCYFNPKLEIDVLAIAYDVIPNFKIQSHQLAIVYNYLGLNMNDKFHLAINDIEATIGILNKMIPMYSETIYVSCGHIQPRLFSSWYWKPEKGINHNLSAIYMRTESGTVSLNETGHYFADKDEGVVKYIDCNYLLKEALRKEGLEFTTYDASVREYFKHIKNKNKS